MFVVRHHCNQPPAQLVYRELAGKCYFYSRQSGRSVWHHEIWCGPRNCARSRRVHIKTLIMGPFSKRSCHSTKVLGPANLRLELVRVSNLTNKEKTKITEITQVIWLGRKTRYT